MGRYHLLSGNILDSQTDLDLLNISRGNVNRYYPLNLNFLCSKLPDSFNITPNNILNNNTCFPFFRPFLKTDISVYVTQKMKNGIISPLNKMAGLYPSNISNDRLIKICNQCVIDDKKKYGEAYIHRIHQIPGIFICPHHNTLLEYIDLINSVFDNKYFVLENIIDMKMPIKLTNNIYEKLLKLQSDIICFLNTNTNDYNIVKIMKKYKNKLINSGYYSGVNLLINHKKLVSDFLSFYGEDFLNFLNSNINIDASTDWLDSINRNLTHNLHPLRHFLFIRFLFGKFDCFINQSEEFLPFGRGPWPCLNITSDHYKEDIITSYKLKKSAHDSTKYGIFKCDKCGFSYSRTTSDGQELSDKYTRKAVINWGPVWEKRATNLITTQNYSIRELSSILGCSFNKVISHATKNNLLNLLNTKERYRAIKDPIKERANLLEQYKKKIKKFISKHKDMLRKDVFKTLKKECTTVLKNDKEWYDSNMPPKTVSRKGIDQVFWQKKDIEISCLLSKAIDDIKSNTDSKLNKKKLAKDIGYSCFLFPEMLSRMPITKKIIEDSHETKEEYLKRKINYIIKTSYNNGDIITLEMILSKLHISKNKDKILCDFAEELIKKYYSS
jgi:transposase